MPGHRLVIKRVAEVIRPQPHIDVTLRAGFFVFL